MLYDRCPQHNLRDCLMCSPAKRPTITGGPIPVAIPRPRSGWSPEDALDAMSGPGVIQAQKPTTTEEMDQATKDALARQEEMRAGTPIVIPGVTDVPSEDTIEAQDMISQIDPEISQASVELGVRSLEANLRPTIEAVQRAEQEQNPIMFATSQYDAADKWVEKARQLRDDARRRDDEAQSVYEAAVADRDLKKEILQKLVAGL